ncbi:serine/threonine-protein kinase PBS1 [Vigna unguiculata]|uniref:non-specific serine/threonine protein kinase n=1 Tax=Vigna unguiculata TaxID=3917 RepID=A0A4D6N9K7_VIGUN|nr:serine/threonine-protein kinase PBS1 [Vigna unguiculata]
MRSEGVVLSFSLLLLWLPLCFQICLGGDTLKVNQNITQDSSEGNLVSSNATFELGFFSPSGMENGEKRYLGIWYHGLEPQTVVWVANRDDPVADSSGVFRIAEDGNLVVEDAFKTRWSSELGASSSSNRTLQLLDSGNLVLKEDDSETTYLWESFQNPTDTFLPGMKMDASLSLTCWRDSANPAPGNFTFKLTQQAETRSFVVQSRSQIYWTLAELDLDNTEAASQVVFNLLNNDIWNTKTYNYSNKTLFVSQPYTYNKSRLLMNYSGEIVFLKWDEKELQWNKKWSGPESKCDMYDYCGSFSLCNKDNSIPCRCFPGFSSIHVSRSDGEWKSKGCVRKSASCTNNDVMFLNFTNIKVDDPDQEIDTQTEAECQSWCINMCPQSQCQAYSFNTSTFRDSNSYSCNIWTRPLTSLVENYPRGRDLSILVKTSDIAPTAKSCEPCGIYAIPYPLSTGANCGDPTYNNFNCDKSTGKVSFMIPGGRSYPVTWIDEDTRMFLIKTDYFYLFNSSFSSQNRTDFPFNIAEYIEDSVIKMNWLPAPEPPCSKLTDCMNWPNSTCRATGEGGSRCRCDSNYNWNDTLISCTQEELSGNHSTRLELILLPTLGTLAAVTCIIAFGIVWRKKKARKLDGASTRIQESLYESERHVKGLIGLGSLEEKDIEGIEVPFYTFASILAATDNFSDSNKLGRGGYGPVYKGTFPGGQEIAVKRLSSVSTQGLQEFKNEVILIAKLQHRNLVRLRGYCIKGDENILLYEYMPNKSLDSFIFDRSRTILLDWPMRFEIIVGIARGMLYLHQDSRLRVIHRDLKTSNVLLDQEMNPKISDFGLAKIFGGKETEASTERVMGTYGYMAPEYALDGLFSVKSDVFSFGVVLLEILSGKRNTGFYESKQISSLLGYAWKLWSEKKLLDIMDPSLGETCNENQFFKCAVVGLLCIQDEPSDRPTMSNVLYMLDIETTSMPIPTQPTFFMNKRYSGSASSSSKPETSLKFDSSYEQGR